MFYNCSSFNLFAISSNHLFFIKEFISIIYLINKKLKEEAEQWFAQKCNFVLSRFLISILFLLGGKVRRRRRRRKKKYVPSIININFGVGVLSTNHYLCFDSVWTLSVFISRYVIIILIPATPTVTPRGHLFKEPK